MKFFELFDILSNTTQFGIIDNDNIIITMKNEIPYIVWNEYCNRTILSVYQDGNYIMIKLEDK